MDERTGRRRPGGWAWLLGATAALAGCGSGGSNSTADTGAARTTTTEISTTTAATVTSTTGAPGWAVIEVIDGDTVRVQGPMGAWTVRLIGINAPEDGECFADRAARELARLVTDAPLRLVSGETDLDRFGRRLRYVETASGADVGAELVRDGFALAVRYEPDTARNDEYERLQVEAQQAGRGLWAPDACGPATEVANIEVTIWPDAPGDDSSNLNGEWVRFTNEGTAPLDLDGWVVADESASHRYTFRGLVLPPGGSVTLFSGCGVDTPTERYWCNVSSAVWNNSGDTVFLRDPDGNLVIAKTY